MERSLSFCSIIASKPLDCQRNLLSELNNEESSLISKQSNVLRQQLERHFIFELDSFAWRCSEQKTKVYMNDPSIFVKENVAIMSVFDL